MFGFIVARQASRTTTHRTTDCLSRLVPSSEGGGWVRGSRDELRQWVHPRVKILQKEHFAAHTSAGSCKLFGNVVQFNFPKRWSSAIRKRTLVDFG